MTGINLKAMINMIKEEVIDFFHGTRLVIFLVMLVFVKFIVIDPLSGCSEAMGSKLSFAEPFIALGNSEIVMLSIPVLFIVLMADFPKSGRENFFNQVRTSRATWISAQILFGLIGSIINVCFLFLSSVIMSLGWINTDLKFSYAITNYHSKFPEKIDITQSLLPNNIYTHMTAGKTLIITMITMILSLWLLYIIVLLGTVLNKKNIGLLVAVTLVIIGIATIVTKSSLMWFFPMVHTIPWIHFKAYLSEEIFPMWGSYLYITIFLIILITACFLFKNKYQSGK